MEVKIFLVCLAVVVIKARLSHSHVLIHSTSDCACFEKDKDSIRISKLANKYGKHERKVVYLFKHQESQEISIYIPNEDKQLHFPDLTVNRIEYYDLHKMTDLHYIFDNPSIMVSVGDQINSVDYSIDTITIDPDRLNVVIDYFNRPENHGLDILNPNTVHDLQPKPTVDEIEVNTTVQHHGEPVYVIIDDGTNQPTHDQPSTEDKKLPSTPHEHTVDSVTLVPEHQNVVIDYINRPDNHGVDILNPNTVDLQPKPTVNEIEVDTTVQHHGEPVYVIIDDGTNQPTHDQPSTEDKKLPSTPHEHTVDSVTLVPEHHNVVIDYINRPDNHAIDNLNPNTVQDLQPKPTVDEIEVDTTIQHHGEPVYVIIDDGTNQPTHDQPSTQDKKLPSTPHEHTVDSVTLVPEHQNVVIDYINRPDNHAIDNLNPNTVQDLQPKPTVDEIEVDTTIQHHGEPVYVIIDDGTNQPTHEQPSTQDKKLPSTPHEHTVDSVTLVPEHQNVVIDFINPPDNHGVDILNPNTVHGGDQDLQPKPTVDEIEVDTTVQHHGEPVYVIIDDGTNQPTHDQPSTQDKKLPSTPHEHTVDSVTLVPEHQNVVIDFINPSDNHGVDILNPNTVHGGDQDLQPKPTVDEIEVDTTVQHHGEPVYVIIDDGTNQPTHDQPSTEDKKLPSTPHEHTVDSVTLVPEHHNVVIDFINPPDNHGVDILNPNTVHGGDQDLQPKPTVDEIEVDTTVQHHGEPVYVVIDENTKNIHGDDVTKIDDTALPNKVTVDSGKQTLYPSVSEKPKDGEDVTVDNSLQSQELDYNFIKKVQDLLAQDYNNVLLPPVNVQIVNSPVFNTWFIAQITNIVKSGPGTLSPSTINLNQIKNYLVQILAQNGLQISENGYLIDIRGQILQMSNLKLRRVMISDPMAYKKVLGGHKCIIPYEIPYLEAAFVSLVHPNKILGLIPLRMSFLPGCRGNKCIRRPCPPRKHRPLIAKPSHPTKLNLAPIHNKHDRPRYYKPNSIDKHRVLEHLNLIGARIGNDEDDKTPHGDNDDEDEGLDTRIIGGNPATGSGTPVSSRGR